MADYTLRQLEYFVAVADAGSVTNAAAAVHLSQSAMSTALADLEASLGVQLLVRHHARGVTLTAAGRQIVVASREILAAASDLRSAAGGLGSSLAGTLSVGCFEVVAPYVLPDLHAAVASAFPDLELTTTEVDLADLADGVADGTFELGIGYDFVDDPRLQQAPLFSVPPYVLLADSHPLARSADVALSDLAADPMVLLDLPHSADYFRRIFVEAGAVPNIRYRSTTVETCRALVGRGLAYTVLNLRPVIDTALDGHPVVAVPIAGEPSALTVVLVTGVLSRPTRRATVVAELCRTLFTAHTRP